MLGTLCALVAALSTTAPNDVSTQPVQFSVWAVQALKTGSAEKHFDSAAQSVRKTIADLPYDTFRGLFTGSASVAPGAETRLKLNETYTLLIQCRTRDGKDGAHVDLTVELTPTQATEAPRKAVQTCIIVSAGKKVRIGGLKMKEGEMVVVLEMTG
jgi:hypothetical protein